MCSFDAPTFVHALHVSDLRFHVFDAASKLVNLAFVRQ